MGTTPSIWNFGSNWPRWSENADSQSTFARSSSAVTPSEKSSINTNRKSTMRFPVSLRWTFYVDPKPPKGAQKRKTAVLRVKSHFAWRKSAARFLCMKTDSDKVVRHSLVCLSVQNGSRGHPIILRKKLAETDQPPSQSPIFNQY